MWALLLALTGALPGSFAAVESRVTHHPNKRMATQRFYENGRKVGIHKTWYPGGQLKSQVEFNQLHQAVRYRDWFENGRLSKQILFEDGMETETKIYRPSGQIYLNRIVRNGRVYGLPGGKACAGVKTEEP